MNEALKLCAGQIIKGTGFEEDTFSWDINDVVLLVREESAIVPHVGWTARGVVVLFEIRADDGCRCRCSILFRTKDNSVLTDDQSKEILRLFRSSVSSIWPEDETKKDRANPDDFGVDIPLEGPFPDGKPLELIWTVPELLLRSLRVLNGSVEFRVKGSPSQALSREFGGKPNRYGQVVQSLRKEGLLDVSFDTETRVIRS